MAKSFGEQFEDALKKGETNKANWLINFLKDDDKKMALMKASKGGHLEVVKRFIEMGFDINQKDDKGNTALDCAFSSNNVELVEMMLDGGAKIDLCNTGEDIILAWGTYVGSLKVVDKFIEEKTKPGVWHKCNLEVKDASDVTLLMMAIQLWLGGLNYSCQISKLTLLSSTMISKKLWMFLKKNRFRLTIRCGKKKM